MPEFDDITYSRDACVATVRDYYKFLTKMYLPECQVVEPPQGGWPSIIHADPSILESFGKTDGVISLLAHLPYLLQPNDWTNDAEGAADCLFADWQHVFTAMAEGREAAEARLCSERHMMEELPPHCVGLTYGGRDNPLLLLDTELGVICWDGCPDSVKLDPTREPVLDDPCDYAPEGEWDWRCDCPAWAIDDFFELFKNRFRRMDWIPTSPRTVLTIDTLRPPEYAGLMPMLARIYREHGWPDVARYRKGDCLVAVRKALEEEYPEEVDPRNDVQGVLDDA
ncbi:hypothetical protein JX265_007115 [Neoarthrinium moseri]|uniref:Uncharacterized protein n=1 Tax=Neoarthrinium moseri TaxID=1658444 RepID=A0A9P9WKI1_9PEZI|nr:hypothetical protein JX265_007115 [Neoarthrinium moseri]